MRFMIIGKVCSGLGSAATNVHRDIYKAAKSSLSGDRALHVRSAAASCIMAMAPYCSFIYEAPNGMKKRFNVLHENLNISFKVGSKLAETLLDVTIDFFRPRKPKRGFRNNRSGLLSWF